MRLARQAKKSSSRGVDLGEYFATRSDRRASDLWPRRVTDSDRDLLASAQSCADSEVRSTAPTPDRGRDQPPGASSGRGPGVTAETCIGGAPADPGSPPGRQARANAETESALPKVGSIRSSVVASGRSGSLAGPDEPVAELERAAATASASKSQTRAIEVVVRENARCDPGDPRANLPTTPGSRRTAGP